MKKNYFLIFSLILLLNTVHGQQSSLTNAQSNLGKVKRNIDLGIASYNLEDLKYHAKISKKSIEIAIKLIKLEQCQKALDLSDSVSIYIDTALGSDELVAAKIFLKKTKKLITEIFYEHDLCNVKESSEEILSDLQQQQAELKAQQALLEQRAKEIKLELAEQEEKELLLEKKELVSFNERVLATNIDSYNSLLKSCNCNKKVLNKSETTKYLINKSIKEIRFYYLNKSISISEDYVNTVKDCTK